MKDFEMIKQNKNADTKVQINCAIVKQGSKYIAKAYQQIFYFSIQYRNQNQRYYEWNKFFCSIIDIRKKKFQNNIMADTNNKVAQQEQQHSQTNLDDKSVEEPKRVPGLTGKKQWPVRIISFLLFAATVALVYVFGQYNQVVSDNYSLYVTPPGLFFTIWAAIFVLKAIANIINLILNVWTLQAHIFVGINNLLLILWTFIFNINNDPAVYCSFLIIFAIIPITLIFWTKVGKIQPVNWFTYLTRNTYAFYLGWIVAATNVNFGILIVYWWMAAKLTQMIIFWVMAPLSAIGITALNVYRERLYGLKSCFALWISVIWAFVGAAISSDLCVQGGCEQ